VIKTGYRKISILILMTIGTANYGISQPLNYRVIFNGDWENAVAFISENRTWIEPELEKYNISFPAAMSVIFPELIRYSALRDKMEITLCKSLYIHRGEKYADFSIGVFQMKPSFAEIIREEATIVMGQKSKNLFKDRHEYPDIVSYRTDIIKDLENPEMQLNYLIAFMKICESRFKLKRMEDDFRLKFIATAYNYGVSKEQDQIESMMDKKFFNTKVFQQVNYSYSDVSLFWYKEYTSGSQ
jgi:hypothetical protein